MRRRFAFVAVALLAVVTASVVIGREDGNSWDDPVEQWSGIRFSHRLHVAEQEAECTDCHEAVGSSRNASDLLLPGHDQCGGCHDIDESDESSCAECHVDGEPAGYEAPVRVVRFDHEQHVTGMALACDVCHAGVGEAEAPSVAYLPSMDVCSTCHRGVDAPRACEACHENPDQLIPLSHRELGWEKAHQEMMRVGGWSNDCAACHSENDCQACHVHPSLQLTETDPAWIAGESRPSLGGQWPLVLQDVHDLNYRFTHSTDFRSKGSDCYVCHDQRNFCVACHERERETGLGPLKPLDHGQSGFVRFGVGSGGGRHAELARRDIESCTGCHDVQGRDPRCLSCHMDRTPGVGNDPRTHSSRFNDQNGEWHSNPGSVCFNCHQDTGRAGIGFCGYCHGVGG